MLEFVGDLTKKSVFKLKKIVENMTNYLRICLNCFMLSYLPCSYAFCWSADLLSLHLITFFNVFYSCSCHFSLEANACLRWSLPSITEQQVCPHRLPVQYWLKNHWPDQAHFKHSLHTNCISNSAILHNNYISLLSDLCACVHVKKKWRRKGSHSSSVSGSNRLVWLQTWKKAMGWCTAQ